MRILNTEFGRIQIKDIPMPEGIVPQNAIYLTSGRLAINYSFPGEEKDRVHIATLNDDGTGFREIFNGLAPMNPKANGFRFMPFPDNKRALIGDYVLETEPDLDTVNPTQSRMVPIRYPDEITSLPNLWMVWSEIIVHPDNEHMGFNALGAGAGVYVAKLRRTETEYVLDDVQTISITEERPDPDHPGCILSEPVRGGEIKQFVNGGRAVSMAGHGRGAGGSIYQALDSREVREITQTPGYDETTIFSPDNRLGITMSTRFSPKTNSAFLGLIPRRGNLGTKALLTNLIYMYGVAGVRQGLEGNIGPALIDIERSQKEPNYLGVNLSDPAGEWAYYSPMSWHPSGRKVMWNEGQKRNIGHGRRVMVAELLDHTPAAPIPACPLPEIPYAKPGVDPAGNMMKIAKNERIAGRFSGAVTTTVGADGKRKTVYAYFSDDGKSFLDGWETAISPGMMTPGDSVYEAKMTLTGKHTGVMNCRVVFRMSADGSVRITEESDGFVRYDKETIQISDIL
ncbi:MAG: hypothetical protein IK099_10190 [Clostridia bacterium]|nr:hypothetical protein [Clostridia bacterium]